MIERQIDSTIQLDYSSNFASDGVRALFGLFASKVGLTLAEERVVLARKMGLDVARIAYARQVHSNRVRIANGPGFVGECDGLITRNRNVILSIQVADCVPIYLYAPDAGAIGLIHSGWRGSSQGIVENSVKSLANSFGANPKFLEAYLGPSIEACCYEIQEEVTRHFSSDVYEGNDRGTFFLNLPKANRNQLESSGVGSARIETAHRCTYCDHLGFHSYRRDGSKAGRNICFMMLD